MIFRKRYIAELEEENRNLREEMFDMEPHSPEWNRNRREIKANMEEIAIMKQINETTPADTEVESNLVAF